MNKPFTIKVQETEQKIVEIINTSQLPAYVLKTMLINMINELDNIDAEEIKKYNEEQLSQEKEKESDK
jgi:hypothetical protein